MVDTCKNCGSTKELISDVIVKCDHYYDAREVTTICGNCFWPKSRIGTYVDELLQKESEEPFRKYGERVAKFVNEGMDSIILERTGAG